MTSIVTPLFEGREAPLPNVAYLLSDFAKTRSGFAEFVRALLLQFIGIGVKISVLDTRKQPP